MDFTFLSNLTFLDLSNNPIKYPNELASQLSPLVKLNTIALTNLSIKSIDSNFFIHNTKLETIYLNDNNISTLSFNSLNSLRNLKTLDLSNNQITVHSLLLTIYFSFIFNPINWLKYFPGHFTI